MTLHTVAADGAPLDVAAAKGTAAVHGLARDGRWLMSVSGGWHLRWLARWLQVTLAGAWNLTVAGICALARWVHRDPRYVAMLAAVGVFRVTFDIDPLALWWVGPLLGVALAGLNFWVQGREA